MSAGSVAFHAGRGTAEKRAADVGCSTICSSFRGIDWRCSGKSRTRLLGWLDGHPAGLQGIGDNLVGSRPCNRGP
jgi:hypothetical protein